MKRNKLNAAIQLLPLGATQNKYAEVDKAISVIQDSGLRYMVCPFETVVEGTFEEIFKLLEAIKSKTLNQDNEEIIINVKLHCHLHKDLFIDDKLSNYQP